MSGSESDILGMFNIRPMPMGAVVNAEANRAPSVGDYGESLLGLSGTFSVWRNDESQVLVRSSCKSRYIESDLRFPDSQMGIPDRFDTVDTGIAYLLRKAGGIGFMISSSMKASSDNITMTNDDLEYSFVSGIHIPASGNNAWLAMLFWDNRNELLRGAPIPGVGYHWKWSPQFEMVIGLPLFSLRWRPTGAITCDAGLVGGSVQSGVALRPWHGSVMRLGIKRDQWRSWRAGRIDEDVAVHQQEWIAGLTWDQDLPHSMKVRLSTGYAFGRYLSESRLSTSLFGTPDDNALRLENGFTIGITCTWIIP